MLQCLVGLVTMCQLEVSLCYILFAIAQPYLVEVFDTPQTESVAWPGSRPYLLSTSRGRGSDMQCPSGYSPDWGFFNTLSPKCLRRAWFFAVVFSSRAVGWRFRDVISELQPIKWPLDALESTFAPPCKRHQTPPHRQAGRVAPHTRSTYHMYLSVSYPANSSRTRYQTNLTFEHCNLESRPLERL